MTFQVVEKDAIVLNSADPLRIGRVQVFIYGVHDITGVKTPFENLPWAYSAQGTSVAIPPIWSSVRVKYRFSFGQNIAQAFAKQDALEWHSPSPFVKLSRNRDPRLFLKYDQNQQKFLNQTPIDLDSIKFKISELERLKQEKESQRDVLVQTLKDIETDPLLDSLRKKEEDAVKKATEELPEANKVLKEQQTKLNNLILTQEQETTKFFLDQLDAFENYYKQNLAGTYGDVGELYKNNKSVYDELKDKFNAENYEGEYEKLQETHRLQKERQQFFVDSASATLENLSSTIKSEKSDYKNRQKSLTNDKIAIQKELETKILEIQEVDKQINDLKSTAASSPNAELTFESNLRSDARISRFDKETGYVYDNQNQIIGMWTGSFFYIPGYAGQPGTPIPDRLQEGLIDYNSYLIARNSNGSESNDNSSIISPKDSIAITKSNNNKEFSCDISAETRLKILTKRSQVANAIRWLRDQIVALFPLDGNSATSQWVKATAKHLTALLKDIQKFLNFVNNVLLEIVRITTYIRSVINWILSLPARLLALLSNCITHFLNSISSAFSEAISTDGIGAGQSVSFAEVTALVSQAQSTFQTATNTVELTARTYIEIKTVEETFEKV